MPFLLLIKGENGSIFKQWLFDLFLNGLFIRGIVKPSKGQGLPNKKIYKFEVLWLVNLVESPAQLPQDVFVVYNK